MATTQTIILPDLGDFDAVEVIEVLVKAGDTVCVDDSLIVLESDKASIEVPAITAGRIVELTVKVGDKVTSGERIGSMETAEAASAAGGKKPTASAQAAPPVAAASAADVAELVVLGAGPGGYSAAFRAADLGLEVTLIERYPTLGGVCLNVGCIPSKALLHVTEVMAAAQSLDSAGVRFTRPRVDLDALRAHKEKVIGKLTSGLAAMAKMRNVTVITGSARFSGTHELTVTTPDGEKRITFRQCVIAAGSESVRLPFLPEDERIIDSTGALKLTDVPKRMLVIGGGIIGLEMATVYHALGSRIDVVEMLDDLMAGADRDLVQVWQKRNHDLFENVMTATKTVAAVAKADGIHVSFEGEKAPANPQRYDRVLVAVGRRANGKTLDLEAAGLAADARGFIAVDRQMRTAQAHIFAIGDIVGEPMLAHKAVHEAHVAAEAAAGHKAFFDARVIPGVAYTAPEVAWVGMTEARAKGENHPITKAVFPWAASGRAIANGCDDGFTKLIVDNDSGHVIGGGIVGPNAGDMIGEIALAIELNADPGDIALTIHPHPTLGETIGLSAEVFTGSCTDLPPRKKK